MCKPAYCDRTPKGPPALVDLSTINPTAGNPVKCTFDELIKPWLPAAKLILAQPSFVAFELLWVTAVVRLSEPSSSEVVPGTSPVCKKLYNIYTVARRKH